MTITQIWKERETDGSWSWSWSRVYSTITGVSSVWAFWHVIYYTGKIPDWTTLSGLAAWAIHGYAVNKGFSAFAKLGNL